MADDTDSRSPRRKHPSPTGRCQSRWDSSISSSDVEVTVYLRPRRNRAHTPRAAAPIHFSPVRSWPRREVPIPRTSHDSRTLLAPMPSQSPKPIRPVVVFGCGEVRGPWSRLSASSSNALNMPAGTFAATWDPIHLPSRSP